MCACIIIIIDCTVYLLFFSGNFILDLKKTLTSLENTWKKVLMRWLLWKFGSYKVFDDKFLVLVVNNKQTIEESSSNNYIMQNENAVIDLSKNECIWP